MSLSFAVCVPHLGSGERASVLEADPMCPNEADGQAASEPVVLTLGVLLVPECVSA